MYAPTFHHSYNIARKARLNYLPIVSVHRDYDVEGRVLWRVMIGITPWVCFCETVASTRVEAIERAVDIARASGGFITQVWAQRGKGMIAQKF